MKIKFNILASALSLVATSMGATYYVNPSEDPVTGGNDAWDGTAEVWDGGESLHGPKRTLVGVMEVATSSGDVVIALPGTYADGLVETPGTTDGDQYVRVIVPAGVTLKSKYGAKATIIMGKAADNPAEGGNGCGTGSPARCAQLSVNSRLEGFTVTGGRTVYDGTVNNNYGGITAPATATIAYCIISNNAAYRSGAVSNGRYFGCVFLDNRAIGIGKTTYYNATSFYNCYFDYTPEFGEVTGAEFATGSNDKRITAVNCTFGPRVNQLYGSGNGGIDLYNCIDLSVEGAAHAVYNKSVYQKSGGTSSTYNNCARKTFAQLKLNDDCSPQADSIVIDAGTTSLYYDNVPAALNDYKDFDFVGFSRVVGDNIDIGCYEYDPNPHNWYVNRATGSDLDSGRSADKAFRTLAAATKADGLRSGDVIYVAPGIYDEGMDDVAEITRCRVRVPAGVTLKATGGAEQTFIMGANSTHELARASGNGTNAVRCVYMDDGARVEGFTLTGGRTAADNRGGGAAGVGYLVDCVVSNNSAFDRGGAVQSGVRSVRCRCRRNSADGLATISQGGAAFFDCYFADNVKDGSGNYAVYGSSSSSPAKLYNCTFAGGDQYSVRGATINYNCLFLGSISGGANGTTSYFYSCALPKEPSGASNIDEYCIITNASNFPIDSECRPLSGNLCIDAGSNLCYTAAFPLNDPVLLDLCGTNRIYNGRIDIGCCEYDWRGIYSQDIAKKQVSVTEASAGVKETDEKLVSLSDGDSLTAEFSTTLPGPRSYVVHAAVTGSGTLTVSFPDGGGTTVVEADGDREIVFTGSASPCSVVFSFAGEGTAVLHDFEPPRKGVVVSFR